MGHLTESRRASVFVSHPVRSGTRRRQIVFCRRNCDQFIHSPLQPMVLRLSSSSSLACVYACLLVFLLLHLTARFLCEPLFSFFLSCHSPLFRSLIRRVIHSLKEMIHFTITQSFISHFLVGVVCVFICSSLFKRKKKFFHSSRIFSAAYFLT